MVWENLRYHMFPFSAPVFKHSNRINGYLKLLFNTLIFSFSFTCRLFG